MQELGNCTSHALTLEEKVKKEEEKNMLSEMAKIDEITKLKQGKSSRKKIC